MRSQWECLLQNLGEWQGSFTSISPQGEILADTPTVITLQALNNNQTMRQTIRRLLPSQPATETVLEYSSLGRQVLFFDNGAFSQGSIQLAPFSEFGAELGLIHGDRRLRLVQLFNKTGQLDKFTLIREKLAGATTLERPPLGVDDLVGEWQGEAVTRYPDWQSPDTYPTTLRISKHDLQLVQQLTFTLKDGHHHLTSTAKIEGSRLLFDGSVQRNQVLLLADGASATCPQQIKVGQAFVLEVGWLIASNLRQRLIRSYSDRGEWSSLTLVTEQRVN